MTALFLFLAALLAQQPQSGSEQAEAGVRGSAAPQASTASAAPQDRLICRRRVRSGTLAGFENDCRTAAEWRALYRGTGESWRQIQGAFGSTNCRANGGTC